MEVYATNARNGVYIVEKAELIAKLQEPQYGYNIHTETTGGVTGITVKQNGTVVNSETAATVVKAEQTPAETSATLTVIPDGGEDTEYYIIDGGKYYLINLVGAEITIGEGQESVESSGSGSSPTLTIDNAASLTKLDEPQISGLTITIVGRAVGDETLTISYGGQTAEVKVTVREPVIAFRNYGEARNAGAYGNNYSIGTIVVNGVTIADNWKIFYEDDDFLYLIYGDYYPAGAQTEITSGNKIFAPAHVYPSYETDSSYAYSINSGYSKATLLSYLKNNSGYTWSTASPHGNDSYANGTSYQSWNNLKDAISTKFSGKTISVQGSPDIDLWVKSWNAKYSSSAKLKATKEIYGYDIMLDTESSNSAHYIQITQSPYNEANSEINGTGYYDRLYFPNIGSSATETEPNADKAIGYWLASSGCYTDNGRMCMVSRLGYVYCNLYYFNRESSVRPCIAIQK